MTVATVHWNRLLIVDSVSAQEESAKDMPSRNATIASHIGLHARHATLFARKASAAGIPVTVGKGASRPVNATSMLAVMALGAKCGEEVTLTARGDGAAEVLEELVAFLETNHDLTV